MPSAETSYKPTYRYLTNPHTSNVNFRIADDSAEQLRENIRKSADLICRP